MYDGIRTRNLLDTNFLLSSQDQEAFVRTKTCDTVFFSSYKAAWVVLKLGRILIWTFVYSVFFVYLTTICTRVEHQILLFRFVRTNTSIFLSKLFDLKQNQIPKSFICPSLVVLSKFPSCTRTIFCHCLAPHYSWWWKQYKEKKTFVICILFEALYKCWIQVLPKETKETSD